MQSVKNEKAKAIDAFLSDSTQEESAVSCESETPQNSDPVITSNNEKSADPIFPFSFVQKFNVCGQYGDDDELVIYYQAPLHPNAYVECRRYLSVNNSWQELSADAFQEKVTSIYQGGDLSARSALMEAEEDLDEVINQLPAVQDLLQSEDDAPIIRVINTVLSRAIQLSASDIHFETFEKELVVRFRIDGMLQEVLKPSRSLAPLLISRLKIMAHLNIAEKRLPQDGRITLKIAGHMVDVRVSTLPTHHGERIVLRLLDKNNAPLNLELLDIEATAFADIKSLISQPHGIILVTGPTGSGKSTTLYGALNALNSPVRNVMTVEDPIEYDLNGIGQTQVNPKVEMTFARGLRAILRQDPDVVMVGEIRDSETATMAVQASLTGHLVLSTLHTNSALGALSRLQDLGVESFLVTSTLIGVIAQRLVRRLCQHCKEMLPATAQECELLGLADDAEPPVIGYKKGCAQCHDRGYAGRIGLYEVIKIEDSIRDAFLKNKPMQEIESIVRSRYPSMRQDGWRRVLLGQTTISEVLRVTSAQD